jgi:predicted Zn-ribbon and HTH transcriptional regulator
LHETGPVEDETASMKEYRCRNCGQVFQIAEIPDEPLPDPVQCPACLGEDLEPLWAFTPPQTPPPAEPPDEPATG